NDDGTFKSDEELKKLYEDEQVDLAKDTIALCRIGERSALSWFVLHELLGVENVKNYDGSWTEYGSLVGVPIELGPAKQAPPDRPLQTPSRVDTCAVRRPAARTPRRSSPVRPPSRAR